MGGPARPLDPRRGSKRAGIPRLSRRPRGLAQQRSAQSSGDRSGHPRSVWGANRSRCQRDPTGLLLERAVELASPALPVPPDDVLSEALREGQAEAHRFGVTGIHNVETEPVLAAFRQLELRDALRLRVLFHPPVAALGRLLADGVKAARDPSGSRSAESSSSSTAAWASRRHGCWSRTKGPGIAACRSPPWSRRGKRSSLRPGPGSQRRSMRSAMRPCGGRSTSSRPHRGRASLTGSSTSSASTLPIWAAPLRSVSWSQCSLRIS